MSENAAWVLLVLGLFLVFSMIAVLLLAPIPTRATPESPLELPPIPPALEEVPAPNVLEQSGSLAQARKIKGWLRPIGFASRLLTYAALLFTLYIWAPKDISNTPLATLALSDIARTVFFSGFALFLFRALCNPSEDGTIKDARGWLGLVILAGIGIGTP
jgi:hypothetical protein